MAYSMGSGSGYGVNPTPTFPRQAGGPSNLYGSQNQGQQMGTPSQGSGFRNGYGPPQPQSSSPWNSQSQTGQGMVSQQQHQFSASAYGNQQSQPWTQPQQGQTAYQNQLQYSQQQPSSYNNQFASSSSQVQPYVGNQQQVQLAPPAQHAQSSSQGLVASTSTFQNSSVDANSAENRSLYIPLEQASYLVNGALQTDTTLLPELDRYFESSFLSSQYDLRPPSSAAPFRLANQYDLPADLLNLMSKNRDHSISHGLFTEISRAWFVVDGQLFFWDWATDTLNQCDQGAADMIVTVGLVPPKKTVLADHIQHVLVICSQTKVTLLGLWLEQVKKDNITISEIRLQDLPGFSLPNPSGTTMKSVVGTAAGRILFTGSDLCVHEVQYENTSPWIWGASYPSCSWKNWSASGNLLTGLGLASAISTIQSVTVDSPRGWVYALTMSSSIEVWRIEGEKGLSKVATWDLKSLVNTQSAASWLDLRQGLGIVALNVIGTDISQKFRLLVTLSNGARLYVGQHITGGQLIHAQAPADETQIRLDGGNNSTSQLAEWKLPSGTLQGTSEISKYFSGVFISWVRGSPKAPPALLFTCPSTTRGLQFEASKRANPLTTLEESYLYIGLDNSRHISAIGELPSPLAKPGPSLSIPGRGVLHELITEVLVSEPRRFAVLSIDSLEIYEKVRPIDHLARVISSNENIAYPGAVYEFQGWKNYLPQLWSVAIALAQRRLSDGALSLNSPQRRQNLPDLNLISLFMQNASRDFDALKKSEESYPNQTATVNINASSRQEGLVNHVARLLRPIWFEAVVTQSTVNGQIRYDTRVHVGQLMRTCEELKGLREFIDSNIVAFGFLPDELDPVATDPPDVRTRKDIMKNTRILIQQAIEAISFIEILIEYNLPVTLFNAGPLLGQKLLGTSYSSLITSRGGRELAKELVTALMKQQAGPQIGKITSSLQSRCGSFCQPEDVVLYKAMECIRQAKVARDLATRQDKLRESLQHFLTSVAKINLQGLKEIVEDYKQMQFPLGAVRLPLKVAEFHDPESLGLLYWIAFHDGTSLGLSDAGKAACDRRNEIYQLVTGAIEHFNQMLNDQVANNGVHSGLDAEKVQREAMHIACDAPDELFHMVLYQWMSDRGMDDQLLELKADDVRAYLERTKAKPDLVWKYYARRGLHLQAAFTLKNLAESTKDPEIQLEDRVQYLSSALANAQSSLQADNVEDRAPVAFITELEEQSEVANVQSEVWQAILENEELGDEEREAAEIGLNGSLKTMSELFEQYAQLYKLWVCQLLIFHISDYRDSAMTQEIWEALIDQAAAKTGEDAIERLSQLIEQLGQKFHPSPATFPVDVVLNLVLRQGLLKRSQNGPAGWVVKAFRAGSVSAYDIFTGVQSLRGMTPPFTEHAGILYLDEELSILFTTWLKEYEADLRRGEEGFFPAADIDAYINSWLMDNGAKVTRSGGNTMTSDVRERFQKVDQEIRRRFGRV